MGRGYRLIRGDRHRAASKWLEGSPELVIEVNSPSNTKAELADNANTTLLGNGALEVWVVSPEHRTITVYRRTGVTLYTTLDSVPVPFCDVEISVAEVFAGIV